MWNRKYFFLQEDIQELQMQVNSMHKSFGHSSIRSNQSNHDMKSTSQNLASDKPASSRSTYHSITNKMNIDYWTSSGQSTEMNSKSDKLNLGKSTYQLVTVAILSNIIIFVIEVVMTFINAYLDTQTLFVGPKRITNNLESNLESSPVTKCYRHFWQVETRPA